MSDFVLKSTTKRAALAAISLALVVLGAAIWWYVYRERRKTRAATEDFTVVLDERGFRNGAKNSRFNKLIGLDRVASPPLVTQTTQGGRERLRELLLPARRRMETEHIPLDGGKIDRHANDQRETHWLTPPPPYAPFPRRSTALIDAADCRTKIISMSSPTSSEFAPRALYPPPRPRIESSGDRQVVRGVRPIVGYGMSPGMQVGLEGNGWASGMNQSDGRMEHAWI